MQNTNTLEIMVIAPNTDAAEVQVAPGTTVGALGEKLGHGVGVSAIDEMNVTHGPNTVIGENGFAPSALSYMPRIAGA